MGSPVLLVLIVTIGILNVGLGFGLAMYFGFGPPGLDGIFQSLGPMPAAAPNAAPPAAGLGALYIPGSEETAGQSDSMPSDGGAIDSADSLSEEGVLSDVEALTAAARSAMTTAVAPAQQ
jgi:hypothetical protein